jgi:antitoxin component HigA of HigAB toxin-antitoxin module
MLDVLATRKMTQSDLAVAIGASPSLISHVLKGRRKLNLKCSKRLIELFGAELISKVIDWDAMKIPRPVGA